MVVVALCLLQGPSGAAGSVTFEEDSAGASKLRARPHLRPRRLPSHAVPHDAGDPLSPPTRPLLFPALCPPLTLVPIQRRHVRRGSDQGAATRAARAPDSHGERGIAAESSRALAPREEAGMRRGGLGD